MFTFKVHKLFSDKYFFLLFIVPTYNLILLKPNFIIKLQG